MEEGHPNSNFHTSSAVLLLFLAASLVFTFFVFPPSLNLISKVFLLSIRKRWDFLVLALVLFAIACGFLSRSDHVGDGCSSASSQSYAGSFEQEIDGGRCSDDGWWRLHDHDNWDRGRGFGSKPVYSMRTWKEDGDDEELFQDKHVVADDNCGHNTAAEEMEVLAPLPSSALPGARAAPKERKVKRTYHTIVHNPKDGVDKLPAALQVAPLPLPSHFYQSVEMKSGKERVGPATRESSSSLKMKKKNRRRESIKNLESFATSLPLPPPAALHKKKSHTLLSTTPYCESSDDSSSLSPMILTPPLAPPFDMPPWRFARRGHHVDGMSEMTKSPSYSSSEATSLVSCRSPDVNKRAGKFIATFND